VATAMFPHGYARKDFAAMAQTKRDDQRKGKMSREEAGRKGGEKVSQDRGHMAEIGRKGGEKVSRDREHMAEIGRKGGEHSQGGRDSDRGSGRGSNRGSR
jgi:general stress protein YciG